jgi:hypothetical protein
MLLKRKLYIVAIVLAVFFVSVAIAFLVQKDGPKDFKGTLVREYGNEAVI